jgi:hypothetical protein
MGFVRDITKIFAKEKPVEQKIATMPVASKESGTPVDIIKKKKRPTSTLLSNDMGGQSQSSGKTLLGV